MLVELENQKLKRRMLLQIYLSFQYLKICKIFRFGDYPLHEVVWSWSLCTFSSIVKFTIFTIITITIGCRIKLIPIHPYFICTRIIFIINTVIRTFNVTIFNLAKTIFMWKGIRKWCCIVRSWKYTWNW